MDAKKIDRLIAEAEKRLRKLDTKREELSSELQELYREKRDGFQIKESDSLFLQAKITKDSSADEKISLFKLLFRGREDIYARRWISGRSGKSGYQPACRNEWIRGICRKPEVKCRDCSARDFLPFTETVIRNHLKGFDPDAALHSVSKRDFTVGVYPLLPDNTCWFLAADFDKEAWIEDVTAFRKTCSKHKVPVAVERSRSGKGAHAWIFFSEPIPALMARRLGTFLLTETLSERPEIGFDSYDRLYPSQDFLPEGGFGSLIALPLQGRSREMGNTLFINENFVAYQDQWAFLSTISRMSRKEIDGIVEKASRAGKIIGVRIPVIEEKDEEPWKLLPSRKEKEHPIPGTLPKKINLILSNLVYIKKEGLTPAFRNRLIHIAAFQNPEFYKAQAMRLSTFGKPRVISCAEDFPKYIGLPRGCFEEILELCHSLGIKVSFRDEKTPGTPIGISFIGTLRPEQEEAVNRMLEQDTGVLAAATAFGKTVVFEMQFRPFVKNVIVFRGGMGRKQRQALYNQLAGIPDSEERLLIATGRYLGEGFDDARLDTLFLTLPISWRGTLAQYAGRLHRIHYNKKEVRIYDYTDLNVPILEKMYKRRLRGYRAIGYDIS